MSSPAFGIGRAPSNGVDTYGWPAIRQFLLRAKVEDSTHHGPALWQNTTLTPGCGSPSPRPAGACSDGSVVPIDCEGASCCSVTGSGTDGPRWPTEDLPTPEVGGDGTTSVILGHNNYEKLSTFADLALCQRLGFKNVQAYKIWQGALPWRQIVDESCDACASPKGSTKYRTMTRQVDVSVTLAGWDGSKHVEGTWLNRTTTDKFGNLTGEADYSGTATGTGVYDVESLAYDNFCGLPSIAVDARYPLDALHFSVYLDECMGITPGDCGYGHLGSFISYDAETFPSLCVFPSFAPGGSGTASTSVSISPGPVSFSITQTGTATQTDPETGHTATLTADITVTVSLSDPYPLSELLDDAFGLLSEWDLADDFVYPWRTDEYVNIAPLVTFREGGNTPGMLIPATQFTGVPFPESWAEGEGPDDYDLSRTPPCGAFAWTFGQWWAYAHNGPFNENGYTDGVANPPSFDGAILGRPAPVNADGHFDFTHRTWARCDGVTVGYYPEKLGARSGSGALDPSDAVVPKTATQWTENYPLAAHPAGAFVQVTSGGAYVQKWAQTMLPLPSYDFARPYGVVDQAIIDPATVDCATNPDGDARFPAVPSTPADPTWADTRRKGQYILALWNHDYRADACDGGDHTTHTYTQHCLPFSVCSPPSIAISPNGETWDNGVTYGFSSPTFDLDYGGLWQAMPVLGMDDPLWQVPHVPCVDGEAFDGAWRRDDGGCHTDEEHVRYYAQANQFEAILQSHKPAGSPDLPAGCTLVESIAPPAPVYCDGPASSTEWGNFLRRRDCACHDGRFADYYRLGIPSCT